MAGSKTKNAFYKKYINMHTFLTIGAILILLITSCTKDKNDTSDYLGNTDKKTSNEQLTGIIEHLTNFENKQSLAGHKFDFFQDPFNKGFNNKDDFIKKGFDITSDKDIKRLEDDKYIYCIVSIQNLKNNKAEVKIENNTVNITGKILSENKKETDYSKSFPVPEGVLAEKADIRHEENRIKLIFPKK